MYIVELRDGGIKNMTVDSDYKSGCETCDYGAERFNKIVIEFNQFYVTIRAIGMYDYPTDMLASAYNGKYHNNRGKHELTNQDVIDIFRLNPDMLSQFTESQFISYMTLKLYDRCDNVDVHVKTKTIGEMYFGHRKEEETPKDIYIVVQSKAFDTKPCGYFIDMDAADRYADLMQAATGKEYSVEKLTFNKFTIKSTVYRNIKVSVAFDKSKELDNLNDFYMYAVVNIEDADIKTTFSESMYNCGKVVEKYDDMFVFEMSVDLDRYNQLNNKYVHFSDDGFDDLIRREATRLFLNTYSGGSGRFCMP